MDKELYASVGCYIKHYRPATNCEFVFLSWTGAQMDASGVADALSEELRQAGCCKR